MADALAEATQATTILDAVNVMLRSIGEAPAVSLLEGGGHVDVESAHGTLMEVNRQVQGQGWHFNTDTNWEIAPEVNTGFVRLPYNTLTVDEIRDSAVAYSHGYDIVQRGLRLYDRAKHTFALHRPVSVDITMLLSFEDLPQYARTYITIRAARKFAQDELGSAEVSRFSAEDEERALASLEALDNRNEDRSMKKHSPATQWLLRR